jgi:hypothetical protein
LESLVFFSPVMLLVHQAPAVLLSIPSARCAAVNQFAGNAMIHKLIFEVEEQRVCHGGTKMVREAKR